MLRAKGLGWRTTIQRLVFLLDEMDLPFAVCFHEERDLSRDRCLTDVEQAGLRILHLTRNNRNKY